MRSLLTVSFFLFSAFVSFCQPSATTVQADIKKDLGTNVISVTVLGPGKTSTEYVNGGYSTFYRVSLNVKLKTDMPGVTKLLQGAAKYNAGGGRYSFVQYAPGVSQYIGLSGPDTSAIRKLIMTLPEYGLQGADILEVTGINFYQKPAPEWHTLLSVSIPADIVYTYKANYITIETIRQPYSLRLYRKAINAPWHNVAWTTTDSRSDLRMKEILETKTVGEYTLKNMLSLSERTQLAAAKAMAAARPKVDIPKISTMKELMKWYHGLLMEGDYAKIEAATLQLLHPRFYDPRTNMLDGIGESLMNNLKKAITNDFSVYNKQHCTNPQLEGEDKTMIAWWNKDKTRTTDLAIVNEDGRWYFTKVAVILWDHYSEEKAKATMAGFCK